MTSCNSLSTFSSELGCQVLDPNQFSKPEVINAFHKDYVKTHMPEFLTNLRTESMYTQKGKDLSGHVERIRKTKPSHGTVFGISDTAVSVSPKEMMTKRKEFHVYAKAGLPKGVKK